MPTQAQAVQQGIAGAGGQGASKKNPQQSASSAPTPASSGPNTDPVMVNGIPHQYNPDTGQHEPIATDSIKSDTVNAGTSLWNQLGGQQNAGEVG